jgi:hypothetical protein
VEIAAHHASAQIQLTPTGVPVSRPRTVSLIGVKGWYWANQRSPSAMESVGTKGLDKKGNSCRIIGVLLVVEGGQGGGRYRWGRR